MAQTIAIVVETGDDGQAMVVAEKRQGCGSCGAFGQCHGGRAGQGERSAARNQAHAAVGDRVTLTVATGTLLSRLAVLYLVPVGGMLAGAFMGMLTTSTENGAGNGHSIAFSLAGFLLGFAVSVFISRIWSSRRPVVPVITRIINAKSNFPAAGTTEGCSYGKH
ncbi:SoxR reducing system RseC family protein [Desulfosarcina ovata]|uniref:SoxR reducing system protein RseC n=1 Tax=Desulfosarcina ovata subsp. ovata TaxID=2752305 RepID=A0A5K8AHX9_9BACT|nr:SoxR reducing system RseC family protein [Desulfosarcina ovata]BBO92295.1 hypothetical protein DSCOOX_54750 [Desulfosarcina ovata subsp. ovata]